MTLEPILTAAPHVQLHVIAATLAIGLGPVAILRRRRDRLHKAAGYAWVLAMAVTAVSSFWITSFGVVGPFSPIHLLALFALWSLWVGMTRILRGDVSGHRSAMEGLYWRGLLLAGAFNFLPGRVVNRSFFPDQPELGFVVLALGLIAIFNRPVSWVLRGLSARAEA